MRNIFDSPEEGNWRFYIIMFWLMLCFGVAHKNFYSSDDIEKCACWSHSSFITMILYLNIIILKHEDVGLEAQEVEYLSR